MTEVRSAVNSAARRLFVIDLVQRLVWTLAGAAALAAAALIADRLLGLMLGWRQIAPAAGAAVVLVAVVWTIIARRGRMAVAVTLDEAAQLRESLSTALTLEGAKDPWSVAVVDSARQTAAKVNVRAALPFGRPRHAAWPVALLTAFGVLWFVLPNWDLLGRVASKTRKMDQQRQIAEVRAEVQAKDKKLEELLARAKVEVKLEDEPPNDGAAGQKPEPQTPEQIQRAAVRKLTSVTEQLEQMRQGEKAQNFQAMRDAMRQLRQPGQGPLNEFARQLSRGNFEAAKAQLDEASKRLADGSMPEGEREQLKEQLENLAKQMEKIAENTRALEEKLREAGMSPEEARGAAKSPEALSKALENMPALNAAQKEGLMNVARSMQQAGENASAMSEGMQQMAQGLTPSGMDQQGMEGMEQLAGELSEGEMMQGEMAAMDAAMSEAMAQLQEMGQELGQGAGAGEGKPGNGPGSGGTGPWAAGDSRGNQGSGSGNAGQSSGGVGPEAEAADYQIEKAKAKVATKAGPIIGSRLVFGEQVKGESVAEFSDAVAAGSQAAAEAMETMTAPRELHASIKHYFGTLDAKAKSNTKRDPAATPPAEPKK